MTNEKIVQVLKSDSFCKAWNDVVEERMKRIIDNYYERQNYDAFIRNLKDLQDTTDSFLRNNIRFAGENTNKEGKNDN